MPTVSVDSSRPGSRNTSTKENRKVCLTYSRMKRFRDQLPAVIRPDIIPTQDGMVITELDSVPGGIGITACLSALYADREAGETLTLVGGSEGMVRGFAAMVKASSPSIADASRF